MVKNIKSKVSIILVVAMLLPLLSSCSLFSKKAVRTAAAEFGEVIKTGDASDILKKTDGIDRDYKKSFKQLLDLKNYTEEEAAFCNHMISTIEYTVDEKSVKVEKDKARIGMTFSIADLDALKKSDYKDINGLTSAVDSASKKEIEVTVDFRKVDKEWYVTNLDDEEFKDLFSFFGNMPVIGRGTLIETAKKLAEAVVNDDSGVAIYLAGKNFSSVPEIEKAVKECDIINFEYNCTLERSGPDWFVTNLDSVNFGGLLSYKKFKISLNSVDGTYKATKDITDQFIKYISDEYKVGVPSGCEGKIYIRSTLVLKNGKYEVKIDRDAFVSDIKSFAEKNIDKIITNTLGTTSSVGLDAMAKIAGYKDYADMKQKILEQVYAGIEGIDTSSLESTGTYTVSGNAITFASSSATMPATIDNFGNISVEAPVNDPDAQKLLGANKVQMLYQKAA